MFEDLLELRRILDRFIAKYQQQEQYRFEHDPRLAEEFEELNKNNLTKEGFWKGNDIY